MNDNSESISKNRAETIASAKFPTDVYKCEAYETMPDCYAPYLIGEPTESCWYVIAHQKHPMKLGGSAPALCIAK
jgi:hypothetical protein